MATQMECLEKDGYEILGVAGTASDREIAKAYRRFARQLHPDPRPGHRPAEERFKEVSAAYEVIGDPTKRAEHDEWRRDGPGGGLGRAGAGGLRIRVDNVGRLVDLGPIFEDLFSGAGGTRRGEDLQAAFTLRSRRERKAIEDLTRAMGPGPREHLVLR